MSKILNWNVQILSDKMCKDFYGKIINIHPALLPKYGGKGMYGNYVHEAVLENEEKESGITIHWVNENYDEGKTIAQFKVDVHPSDSVKTLREKIQQLEKKHFPKVIDQILFKES